MSRDPACTEMRRLDCELEGEKDSHIRNSTSGVRLVSTRKEIAMTGIMPRIVNEKRNTYEREGEKDKH